MLLYALVAAVVISFGLGLMYPKRSGWCLLYAMPILSGMPGLTIVPYKLPLKIIPVAFFVTLGIAFSTYRFRNSYSPLLRQRTIKFLIIFLLLLFAATFRDDRTIFFFSYLPAFVTPFILCYLIIETKDDLHRFIKICVWSSAICGFFCIVEYFTLFNLNHTLMIITSAKTDKWSYEIGYTYLRSGFNRVNGIDGFHVFSAIRMAFFFPLTLWYWQVHKNWLVAVLPVVLCFSGLLLTQTRAAFLSVLISMVFIGFRFPKMGYKYLVVGSLILMLSVLTFFGEFETFVSRFYDESIRGLLDSGYMYTYRIDAQLFAWDLFLERPFFGYGSPMKTQNIVLSGQDVIAPLVYLLSGGVFLGLFYLLFILSIPYHLYKLAITKYGNIQSKWLLYCVAGAVIAGIIPIFTNWLDRHFFVMFMVYAAILKRYTVSSQFSRAF